jgi:hypothetical protein
MYENRHFLRETVVDINAAVIGISSKRWTDISEAGATDEQAIAIMRDKRFDVLPIKGVYGVREYFQTTKWNDFSSVTRKFITHKDVLPFTTSLRDLIRQLAYDSRSFYFLISDHRIVGLVTIADLNSRHVKTYLFSLLSDLEIGLGELVSQTCTESELLQMTFGAYQEAICEGSENKYEKTKDRYKADKENGVDVPFVEYLYLSDLVNVIAKKQLFKALDYPSRNKFEDAFGPLNALRNNVCHPITSLVDGDTCNTLWNRIDRLEDILFRLRSGMALEKAKNHSGQAQKTKGDESMPEYRNIDTILVDSSELVRVNQDWSEIPEKNDKVMLKLRNSFDCDLVAKVTWISPDKETIRGEVTNGYYPSQQLDVGNLVEFSLKKMQGIVAK